VQLFRFATSVYGDSDVIVGASWDLLPWFVAAGAVFIAAHAIVHALMAAGRRPRGGSR
jgi:hypothetical protein